MFHLLSVALLPLAWLGCFWLCRELAARQKIPGDWKLSWALASAVFGAVLTLIVEVNSLFHSVNAPALWPKTWYGMPAYTKDGKVICHFQSADKFKSRYATFGFSDGAKLDDGEAWPVAWALRSLTPAGEKLIVELVKKAVG